MTEYVVVERIELADCSYVLYRPLESSDEIMQQSESWIHKYSKLGNLLWRSKVIWEDSKSRERRVFVGITKCSDGSIRATSYGGEVYTLDEETGEARYFRTVR